MSIKEIIHKHSWRIFFAILLIMLIALLGWFIFDTRNLYRAGMLRPTRGIRGQYVRSQIESPAQIQDWMTFSYVNHIFNLPVAYLSTSLSIQDTHYPDVIIGQYAKSKNLNNADFVKQVQSAVSQYLQGAH